MRHSPVVLQGIQKQTIWSQTLGDWSLETYELEKAM